MTERAYADIALPIPLDQTLTYAVPQALQERVQPGMRAIVPVQRRVQTGYVIGLRDTSDHPRTRAIIDLPDEKPLFSPQMLRLCRWIADYYCCSWGEALQTAVPAGMRVGSRLVYRLTENGLAEGRYTDRQRQVIAALYRLGPRNERQLALEIGGKALSNTLQALVRRGVLAAEAEAGQQGVNIRRETWAALVEEAALDAEALEAMQRRAPKQAAAYMDLLHGAPEQPATQLYAKHQVNAATLKALAEKELITLSERELYRAPEIQASGSATNLALNPEQQAAFDAIAAAMAEKRFQTFLLRGITGSGKTEVYLQAIERLLALGRDAIILVPEISLTPQTVGRFYARFRRDIAVLHSGLSAGERYDEWRRALRGEVRIVVGARSAVFAPLPDVGVIVVDEEHDGSYKQGDTPRYHARDVAIMRARMNNAVCVLGSATPSIESSANVQRGKSEGLLLNRRATDAELPKVHVVDMREQGREHSGRVILSQQLEEAVHARVARKEQVILLLNRRGFAPFVLCPQCGWIAECDDCNVSMTYHSSGGVLLCHYCNASVPRPEICGKCGFNPLIFLGTGTQRAEDYLQRAFSGCNVMRMDADTTAGKGGHAKILGRFAAGEIDILIGTQMLAKGHDYPGVTLVGVINADTGLALPDFRAAESTFQLLTQVAGRAGRGERPGEVFLQTFRPRHYAVQAAATHDYACFLEQEMGYRESAGYPPFRRMADLSIESEDPMIAERAAVWLRRMVRDEAVAQQMKGLQLLGPAPAAVRRVKRRYRWRLGLLSGHHKWLNHLLRHARDNFHEAPNASKLSLKVDMDPYGAF